jgi:hypothetical protein
MLNQWLRINAVIVQLYNVFVLRTEDSAYTMNVKETHRQTTHPLSLLLELTNSLIVGMRSCEWKAGDLGNQRTAYHIFR